MGGGGPGEKSPRPPWLSMREVGLPQGRCPSRENSTSRNTHMHYFGLTLPLASSQFYSQVPVSLFVNLESRVEAGKQSGSSRNLFLA